MASRQKRPNKFVYILAAIGAAAGLGNLWRFPMLTYQYGGGSFILALLISNIFIVLPLIIMETAIGQHFQSCGPKIFAKLKKGTARLQRLPIIATIFIFMYYLPIMAWGELYLVKAFSGNFLLHPSSYFGQEILGISSSINHSGSLQSPILIAITISIIAIMLSLRKGIKSVSKVLKYTVPIPFIILIILGINGLHLPGGVDGLLILFKPKLSQLSNIGLRQAAIGQSFFSASLAFGYFIFAGSHRKKKDEIVKSSILILLGNFIASLLVGITVFSTIGFMAQQQHVQFFNVMKGGAELIFSALPNAISLMPFFKIGFAVLLFITLITLAMSSAFAFIEVITGAFQELGKKRKKYLKIMAIILGIVLIGSIPYSMGAGSYYLEITDHFVGGYIFIAIGVIETIIISKFFGKKRLSNLIYHTNKKTRKKKIYQYLLSIIPIILSIIFILSIMSELHNTYQTYPSKYIRLFGIIPLIISIIVALLLGRQQERK